MSNPAALAEIRKKTAELKSRSTYIVRVKCRKCKGVSTLEVKKGRGVDNIFCPANIGSPLMPTRCGAKRLERIN